jgi:cyclin C
MSIPRIEDGGVSAAHPNRRERSQNNLARYILPPHRVLCTAALTQKIPDVIQNDTAKLAECEFWVISEMNSYLIVHHPYRMLKELGPILQLTSEETNTSWQVINDSCITDLPLIYPPHVIALTAIFFSVVLKPSIAHAGIHAATSAATAGAVPGTTQNGSLGPNGQGPQGRIGKLIEWYAESKVDMEAVIDATQEIISLYEVWEGFVPAMEKTCKEQLTRMVKQRGL